MAIHAATDSLVDYLNSLVALDPLWLTGLINSRSECNAALAQHPTVQVVSYPQHDELQVQATCGLLGLLNGFCGIIDAGPHEGYGPITAVFGDDDQIERFVRTESLAACDGPG